MIITLTNPQMINPYKEIFSVTVDGILRGTAIHGQNASAQIYWAVENGATVPVLDYKRHLAIHMTIVNDWNKANRGRGWRYSIHHGPQSTKQYIEQYYTILCGKYPLDTPQ